MVTTATALAILPSHPTVYNLLSVTRVFWSIFLLGFKSRTRISNGKTCFMYPSVYCQEVMKKYLVPSFLKGERKKVKSLSRVRLFETPRTIAYQAPPSMGFSRQEYWSGLPFLLQGIFPTQGSNPGLQHCRQTLYCLSHQGSHQKGEVEPYLSPKFILLGISTTGMRFTYWAFRNK